MRLFAKRNAMTPAKSPPTGPSTDGVLDRTAVFLSGLCLLHCLAIPIALLLGPLVSEWLIDSETRVHWILLGLALPISMVALWRGYQRHHNAVTLLLGISGLLLMFIGVAHLFGESWEITLTVVGVSALLVAHIRNMRGGHVHG